MMKIRKYDRLAFVGWVVFGVLMLSACGGRSDWVREQAPDLPGMDGKPEAMVKRVKAAHSGVVEGRDPKRAMAELAVVYHANGFLAEAWQCYGALIELEPSKAEWHHLLATIIASYGRLEEAIPLWEDVVRLDPSYAPAHLRLGDIHAKLNRWDEAKVVFANMLKHHPDSPYGLMGMGRVAIANEDWQEARKWLEQARVKSNDRIGVDLLIMVYERLNMKDMADLLYRTVSWGGYSDIPDPWVWTVMEQSFDASQLSNNGGMVAFSGDMDRGLRMIERAIRLSPDDGMLHYQLGNLLRQIGRDDAAKAAFTRCTELNPEFSDGWFNLLMIAKKEGNRLEIRSLLESGLLHCPRSPALLMEQGRLMMTMGLTDEAIAAYRASIEVRPNEAAAYVYLAQALFALDKMDEGGAQLRKALDVEPGHMPALLTMTFYAINTQDEAEAAKWLRLVRLQPRLGPADVANLEKRFAERFGQALGD